MLPNLSAVIGGFGVYAFGLLTPAETRPFGLVLPLTFLAMGVLIVLWALVYLRRAFSVTPQARLVVRKGPYALVRHPMYIGNIFSITAWGLLIGTPEALALSVGACALQICRAAYEDRLLAATFPEYREYMSHVNAFIPRFDFHRPARLLVLVFAIFAAFFNDNASAQIDPNLGEKCQAWLQKALSERWFTTQEGAEFAATDDIQEILGSVPGCSDFVQLQKKCEKAYNDWFVAENERAEFTEAERKRAHDQLIRTIEAVTGCKFIIGFKKVCDVIRDEARRLTLSSPRLQSILQECHDESIATRTSDMIRPAI